MSATFQPVPLHPESKSYVDFEFFLPYHDDFLNKSMIDEAVIAITHIPPKNVKTNDCEPFFDSRNVRCKGWMICQERDREGLIDTFRQNVQRKQLSKQIQILTGVSEPQPKITKLNLTFTTANEINASTYGNLNPSQNNRGKSRMMTQDEDDTDKMGQHQKGGQGHRRQGSAVVERMPSADSGLGYTDDEEDGVPGANQGNPNENAVGHDVFDAMRQATNNGSGSSNDDAGDDDDDKEDDTNDADADAMAEILDAIGKSPLDSDGEDDDENGAVDQDDDEQKYPGAPTKADASSSELKMIQSDLKQTREQLEEKVKRYAEEKEHLERRLAALKAKMVHEKKQDRWQTMSEKVDLDLIHKKEVESKDKYVIDLEERLRQIQFEHDQKLKSITSKHNADIQERDKKLRRSLQINAIEVEELQTRHKREIGKLKADLDKLSDIRAREGQKDLLIKDLHEQIDRKNTELERIKVDYEETIERLNEANQKESEEENRIQVEEKKALRAELRSYKKELLELRQENKDLKRELNDYIDTQRELEQQRESLKLQIQKERTLRHKERLAAAKKGDAGSSGDGASDAPSSGGHDASGAARVHFRKHGRNQSAISIVGNEFVIDNSGESMLMGDLLSEPVVAEDMPLELANDPSLRNIHSSPDKSSGGATSSGMESEIRHLREEIKELEARLDMQKRAANEREKKLDEEINQLKADSDRQAEAYLSDKQRLQYALKRKDTDLKNLGESVPTLTKRYEDQLKARDEQIKNLKTDVSVKEEELRGLSDYVDMLQKEVDGLQRMGDDEDGDLMGDFVDRGMPSLVPMEKIYDDPDYLISRSPNDLEVEEDADTPMSGLEPDDLYSMPYGDEDPLMDFSVLDDETPIKHDGVGQPLSSIASQKSAEFDQPDLDFDRGHRDSIDQGLAGMDGYDDDDDDDGPRPTHKRGKSIAEYEAENEQVIHENEFLRESNEQLEHQLNETKHRHNDTVGQLEELVMKLKQREEELQSLSEREQRLEQQERNIQAQLEDLKRTHEQEKQQIEKKERELRIKEKRLSQLNSSESAIFGLNAVVEHDGGGQGLETGDGVSGQSGETWQDEAGTTTQDGPGEADADLLTDGNYHETPGGPTPGGPVSSMDHAEDGGGDFEVIQVQLQSQREECHRLENQLNDLKKTHESRMMEMTEKVDTLVEMNEKMKKDMKVTSDQLDSAKNENQVMEKEIQRVTHEKMKTVMALCDAMDKMRKMMLQYTRGVK